MDHPPFVADTGDPGPPVPEGYAALREGVAWADAPAREAIGVAGDDAVRFVDGFCTAAVAALPIGGGSEAFFLDARGQVLAWGTVLRAADGVWIDVTGAGCPPGDSGFCLARHLEAYHIRERLEIVDRSGDVAMFLVAGPDAGRWLERAGVVIPDTAPFGHHMTRVAPLLAGEYPDRCAGVPAAVVRGDWAGAASFLVVVPAEDRARLVDRLRADGVPQASSEALDAVRREEGRPAAVDIPARALPQEFGRDRRAISFTKGCYLGQETVARLDALGHVNRRLVGVLTRRGPVPPPGTAVESAEDGATLGTVTSAGPSPRHGGWLALAMVRTAALGHDAVWRVAGVRATPVPLPQVEGWS